MGKRAAARCKADALAGWAAPNAQYIGERAARRESIPGDASEPILKDGDIRAVRLGGRIADGDEVEPGEAVTVRWAGVHQHACGRVVLKQRPMALPAAALAMMGDSQHDVRPHLLLLHFGEVQSSIAPCIHYGAAYLARWCDVCGIGRGWGDAFRPAAADALARVYWGRDRRGTGRPTIADRKRECGIGSGGYAMLTTKAESVFRVRLAEAIIEYERQFTDAGLLAPAKRYNGSRNNENPAGFSFTLRSRAA